MEYKDLILKIDQLDRRLRELENKSESYQNKDIIRKDVTVIGKIYANKVYRKNGANYSELIS